MTPSMGEMRNIATVAAATLISFLLLTRLVDAAGRGVRDPGRLFPAAFLLALGVRLFVPAGAATLPVLWALERLLRAEARAPGTLRWDALLAGSFAALLLFHFLGYGAMLPFRLFSFFLACLFGLFPLGRILRRLRRKPSAVHAATACAALLWPVLAVFRLAGGADGAPYAVLAASCAAGLESWIRGQGGGGGDALLASLHERFLCMERTMERQERLVACGIVAAGAVHEFKNALSLVGAAAEHGMGAADGAVKDRDLDLILEQARASGGAAVGRLERISREGRERERCEDIGEALQDVLSLLRAAFRAEGILVRPDIAQGVLVRCRIGELEQILLNLVRNAVEAYRALPEPAEVRAVEIRVRGVRDGAAAQAVIEVLDSAGGIPPAVLPQLFQFPASGKGSTGVGLYLARELAERNGGRLDHVPTAGGSCFRLTLPAVQAAAAS